MSDRPVSSSNHNSTTGKQPPSSAAAADSNGPTLRPQSRDEQNVPTMSEAMASSFGMPATNVSRSGGEQIIAVGAELGYYRLLKKLGEGGMGSVWQAVHTKLDKQVAVKVLPAKWNNDAALLARFEREMKAVGKLEHPHIVRAMDAGEFNGTHYLVMEFNEGLDLSAYVKQRGPQSVQNACEMLRHAALGLAHAHEAGLIHRDIKPSNLFLTKQGKVKILDLGLARVQGDNSGDGQSLTGFGQLLGTPDYMAPEQWENTHSADARSDLYALGCTLFFLLTGRAPFADEQHLSMPSKMKGHTLDPIPDLKAAQEAAVADRPKLIFDLISDQLDAIYRRLMAKRPDERFASANELAQAMIPFGKQGADTSSVLVKGRSSFDENRPVAPRPESRTSFNASNASNATAPLIMTGFAPDASDASPGTDNTSDFVAMFAGTSPSAAQHDAPTSDPTSSKLGHSLARRAGERRLNVGWIVGGIAAFVLLIGVTAFFFRGKGGSTEPLDESNDEAVTEVKEKRKGREVAKVDSDTKPVRLSSNEGSKKKPVIESDESAARLPPVTEWNGWPADTPKPAIAPFDAEQAKQHQEAWAKYLDLPVEYTNTIGMKFRLIPPGEFMMGSTSAEIEAALKNLGEGHDWREFINREAPQHKVILTQPIYFSVHEVMQCDFEKVMKQSPSNFTAIGAGKEAVAGVDTNRHPVEQVSWPDAAEFCTKLSQLEKLKPFYFRASEAITPLSGTGYRLPSEAEWEYACRAGTTTKFWIGDLDEDLMKVSWLSRNCGGRTHTTGELNGNPFGLYDIHGNVWEWVQDGWEPTYYSEFQNKLAVNPGIPFSSDNLRVVRGGGLINEAYQCRSSVRFNISPSVRASHIGFRVSLPVDGVRQAVKGNGPETPAVASENKPRANDTKPMPKEVASIKPTQSVSEVVLAPKELRLDEGNSVRPPFKEPMKPGDPLGEFAAVARPAKVAGLLSWSVEPLMNRGIVGSVALSSNGIIATGSSDCTIRLWTKDWHLIRILPGHANSVVSVAFSPKGDRLASVSPSPRDFVSMWDVASGQLLWARPQRNWNGRLTWSPDGSRLAVCEPGKLVLLDPAKGSVISEFVTPEYLFEASWSSDGNRIALTRDRSAKVRIVDPAKMNVIAEFENSGADTDAAWSSDGRWLAVSDRYAVGIYDARTISQGQTTGRKQQLRSPAYGIEFSPDSTLLATAHDDGTRLFRTSDWTELWHVSGNSPDVHWSKDGKWLVSGVRVLNVSDGKPVAVMPATLPRTVVGPSPDGSRVATAGYHLRIWNGDDGALITDLGPVRPATQQLLWNAAATKLLRVGIIDDSGTFAAEILDPQNGDSLHALTGHSGQTWRAAWSKSGDKVATVGEDGQCILWDAASGSRIRSLKQPEPQWWVQWSSDGSRLATGSETAIIVWRADSNEPIRSFRTLSQTLPRPNGSNSNDAPFSFMKDGSQLIVLGKDGNFDSLDVKSGQIKPLGVLTAEGSGGGTRGTATWSPDFKMLISATGYRELEFFPTGSTQGKAIRFFVQPHWLADSRRIVGGDNYAGFVMGVDLRTVKRMGVLIPELPGGEYVAVGPDGNYKGSENCGRQVGVVALHTNGSLKTYSLDEFSSILGKKNDPTKVGFLKVRVF